MITMISTGDMPWLGATPATAEKTAQVDVVMAFGLKGVRQEIGSILTLPESLARELIGYRKVIRHIEPAAPESEPAPQAVRSRRKPKE